MAIICLILGVIVFLIMVHPGMFWLVFVPLGLLLVAFTVKFLKGRSLELMSFVCIFITLIIMVIAIMVVCIP